MTLTEFLLARIAEDEAAAQAATTSRGSTIYTDARRGGKRAALNHITRWDPARVLAECEAKRRIVDYRERVARESAVTGVPLFEAQLSAYHAALRALALPHADHPDYREEWRP